MAESTHLCVDIRNTSNDLTIKEMKRNTLYLMTALLLSFTPIALQAAPLVTEEPTSLTLENEAKANTLILRLEEIKAMDKSSMTSKEKKALRKEVRSTKAALSEMNGGVYLSVGAIIIIILLLILLL